MKLKALYQPLVTEAACKEKWAKASPAERNQIRDFIKATTEPRRLEGKKWVTDEPWEGVPYRLTWVRNLDTGRVFLTAGCAGPEAGERGLTANQIRKVVGLPPVKGGDYRLVIKERPLAGGVSLGEVKKGKIRLPSRSAAKPLRKGAKK